MQCDKDVLAGTALGHLAWLWQAGQQCSMNMQAAGNFTYNIMPLNEAPELSLWFEVIVLL